MATFSEDPLDNFIWMRNTVKEVSAQGSMTGSAKKCKPLRRLQQQHQTASKAAVKISDHWKSNSKPSEVEINAVEPKQRQLSNERTDVHNLRKMKTDDYNNEQITAKIRTIEVALSDEYVDLLKVTEERAQPLLNEIQNNKILPSGQELCNLTPDITRFINRQYEHNLQPNSETDVLYRKLLGLHALVTARHLMVHYCLLSAIQALRIMCDKYPVLKDLESLSAVHQTLFNKYNALDKASKEHPKLTFLLQHVAVVKKEKPNDKVLIICNKELQTLLEGIREGFARENVNLILLRNISDSFELLTSTNNNCILALAKVVTEDFPWDMFGYVIEYDPVTGVAVSKIRVACEMQGINYVSLQVVIPEKSERPVGCSHGMEEKYSRDQIESTDFGTPQYLLLGSTVITENSDLLHSLESKHNIQILERDYTELRGRGNNLQFADIDVDAHTGIILENLALLQNTSAAESLVIKLASISSKYRYCWLILFTLCKKERYALGGCTGTNLAKLYSSIPHLCSDDFLIKVLLCENEEQVSMEVGRVAQETHSAAQQAGNVKWLDRDYLQYLMSKHEKFLLSFPCLNSFSAQTLLSKVSMLELMAASSRKLNLLYPFLPMRTVQKFCELKKEGRNIPTDRGDCLDRVVSEQKSGAILFNGENTRNPVQSVDGQPRQDFKLQVNGGVRSDKAWGSEYEWSSSSYEEHEVPDIETLESQETFNEYEMAEREGSRSLTDVYLDRDNENNCDETLSKGNLERDQLQDFSRQSEYRQIPVDDVRVSEHRDKSTEFQQHHSRDYSWTPHVQSKRLYDISLHSQHEAVADPNPPSVRIKRDKTPVIGGQSAYKPGFLENASSVRNQVEKSSIRSGFWTHFSDSLKSTANKTATENDMYAPNATHSNKYESMNTKHEINAQEPLKRRRQLMEIMDDTPRMHQPYTLPHHRTGQNSIWQMPSYPPSVAAVTPSQRNPVPVSEFLQVGRLSTGRNLSSSYTGTGRSLTEQDSPPMDPDSDEENPPLGWPHQSMFIKDVADYQIVPDRRRSTRSDIPGPLRVGAAEYRNYLEKFSGTDSSKKRRLTYERVPGRKGGQTRLSFA